MVVVVVGVVGVVVALVGIVVDMDLSPLSPSNPPTLCNNNNNNIAARYGNPSTASQGDDPRPTGRRRGEQLTNARDAPHIPELGPGRRQGTGHTRRVD